MLNKLIDYTGLQTVIDWIKETFVQKEIGKGLSTEDYTTTDKQKVTAIPESPKYTDTIQDLEPYLKKTEASTTYATKIEVENKVDKVEGKGLSTLDYNETEKSKVDNSINQISVTQNTNNVELNLSKSSGNVTAYIDEATSTKAGALNNTDKAKLDKFTEVENKPYYNDEAIATVKDIPLNTSELTNDSGYVAQDGLDNRVKFITESQYDNLKTDNNIEENITYIVYK